MEHTSTKTGQGEIYSCIASYWVTFVVGSRHDECYSESNLKCNGVCMGHRVTVNYALRLAVLDPHPPLLPSTDILNWL
jgi:hypothetical protein